MMALTESQLQYAAFNLWASSEGEVKRVDFNEVKKALPIVLNECLTATQKTYMMHYFVDGLSVSEIAEMYKVSGSTVGRGIHRGLNNAYKYLRFTSPLLINVPQRRTHLGKGRKHKKRR